MSRAGLRVAALSLWLALASLFAPLLARAALLPTHDLASLAFLAEHVVRATRTGERPGDHGSTITTLRIEQVYVGSLERGATIELDLGLYGLALDPYDRASKKADPKDPVALFLARAARSAGAASAEPELYVVSSGMRVSIDGRMYRFEQWSNPGGFAPVPQVAEPCDDGALGRCDEPVSFERFERDLRAGITRAKQAREAFASSLTSVAALLDWIGPPEGAPGAGRVVLGGYVVDAIAVRASELVAERGELGDLLEGAARARVSGLSSRRPILRFRREQLAEVAMSKRRSAREREAALGLLANGWFPGDEPSVAAIASFAPLLDDAEPRVRRAVIPVLRAHPSADTFAAWLRARHAKETDVEVMRALLEAAGAVKALPFPEPPGVVVPELSKPPPTPSASVVASAGVASSGAPSGARASASASSGSARDVEPGCACATAGLATGSGRRAGGASWLLLVPSLAAIARRRLSARALSSRPS
jgi:hypothetical protein